MATNEFIRKTILSVNPEKGQTFFQQNFLEKCEHIQI